MRRFLTEDATQWQWRGFSWGLTHWLTLLSTLLIFAVILQRGIQEDWSRNGIPSWMTRYEKWEKRQKYEWGLWWRHRAATSTSRSSHATATPGIHAR